MKRTLCTLLAAGLTASLFAAPPMSPTLGGPEAPPVAASPPVVTAMPVRGIKPDPESPEAKLSAALSGMEKRLDAMGSFRLQLTRTTRSAATKRDVVAEGTLEVLRPAMQKLTVKGPKFREIADMSIVNGASVWNYDAGKKTIWASEDGTPNPVLQFFAGTSERDLRAKFDIRFMREDKTGYYTQVAILPRTGDTGGMSRAVLTLWKRNFKSDNVDVANLPKQLLVEDAAGNQIVWDFQVWDTKPDLKKVDFLPLKPSAEWTMKRAESSKVVPASATERK